MSSTNPQQHLLSELHKLFLTLKLSHYNTQVYAKHEAYAKAYQSIYSLLDVITEQMIGYSGIDFKEAEIGSVYACDVKEQANKIMTLGASIIEYAKQKSYPNIENLGQELSGEGAQLMYLSRFVKMI